MLGRCGKGGGDWDVGAVMPSPSLRKQDEKFHVSIAQLVERPTDNREVG